MNITLKRIKKTNMIHGELSDTRAMHTHTQYFINGCENQTWFHIVSEEAFYLWLWSFMEHPWQESKLHLYEIKDHLAFLRGEIPGTSLLNMLIQKNQSLLPSAIVPLLEGDISTSPQRKQVNKITLLTGKSEYLTLSWCDSFHIGVASPGKAVCWLSLPSTAISWLILNFPHACRINMAVFILSFNIIYYIIKQHKA